MKNKRFRNIFKWLILGFILWFGIHTLYIVYDGLKEATNKADIAVILGNKVNEDGTLSERLEKRMEAGLALYETGKVGKIVVSGGLGKEGHYEADKMHDYLVAHDVPDSLIIVDNYGNNTELTVQNLMAIQEQNPFGSVIVVSQYFHITRTKALFRKYGFNDLQSASPHYFEWRDLYAIPREFVAYYVKMIK